MQIMLQNLIVNISTYIEISGIEGYGISCVPKTRFLQSQLQKTKTYNIAYLTHCSSLSRSLFKLYFIHIL